MPAQRFLLFPGLVLAVVLFAGCNTFERRAQEKSTAFSTLTPAQREQLEHGSISIGDTPDMVYIALGEPDEKRETTSAHGHETIWIYNQYQRDPAFPIGGAYRRDLVFDPIARRYALIYAPLPLDALDDEVAEEYIRVTFHDGKVAVIEQPKA